MYRHGTNIKNENESLFIILKEREPLKINANDKKPIDNNNIDELSYERAEELVDESREFFENTEINEEI